MKGILGLLRQSARPSPGEDKPDSMLFTTAFADYGVDPSLLIPWEARANEVGARRVPGNRGMKLLQGLWAKDKYMSRLKPEAIERMESYFAFATVQADRDVIRQDEYGNFMVVLLTGSMAVDRLQPWGENIRLTEARAGDILGEMSLLDSGKRFSLCATLTECEFAVLSAHALDDMMASDPQLAASLIALLARKLSMRLRVVSTRLADPDRQRGMPLEKFVPSQAAHSALAAQQPWSGSPAAAAPEPLPMLPLADAGLPRLPQDELAQNARHADPAVDALGADPDADTAFLLPAELASDLPPLELQAPPDTAKAPVAAPLQRTPTK
jgi:CRP/FNR family transcriptional regulator, cyclic AMP receptor protein